MVSYKSGFISRTSIVLAYIRVAPLLINPMNLQVGPIRSLVTFGLLDFGFRQSERAGLGAEEFGLRA